MNKELLGLLACPKCGHDLNLQIIKGEEKNIISGFLQCRGCSEKYFIEDNIPIFCPEVQHGGVKAQKNNYSIWWDSYHDENSITNETSRNYFYNSLVIRAEEMKGKIILDAGCGNGRFSFIVSHYKPKLLVSFDISSGLLQAKKTISKYNPNANVVYVQGDITNLPFKKGIFDVVFSWGVLHHTPNTRKSFSGISKLVREEGLLGIYVYEFHPLYHYDNQFLSFIAYLRQFILIRPLRFICSRLPAKLVHLFFQPIYYLERFFNFGLVGCHDAGTDKWNKKYYFRVVIDRFRTRYASEQQLEEVIGWFRDEGYNNLKVGRYPKISISGKKNTLNKSLWLNIAIPNQDLIDESITNK